MFHLIFKKYFKSGTIHIFAYSCIVFIVLNIVENVIHYNIGKFHDHDGRYRFTNPSYTDWMRIIVIMLIFALLQGMFTSYFSVC